jgi:predicted transcriptional regulator of viral defense system
MSKFSRPLDFFATHPVFRRDEFVRPHTAGGRSPHTSANVLAQHVVSGRLVRVRGGLFAVVPAGTKAAHATVDPYLVATHLTDDAVVAYHAALQFHGKAYSVWRRFHYVTRKRARPLTFRDLEFVPVQASLALRRVPEKHRGVTIVRHAGGEVRVTTLERTMVDVLDAPDHAGGWEEVWRSLEMVEFFDLDALVAYALALRSAVTAARVGFFLDQHRKELMVEDRHLQALRKRRPKAARYLTAKRESGKLVAGWNLVVPPYVLDRAWAE